MDGRTGRIAVALAAAALTVGCTPTIDAGAPTPSFTSPSPSPSPSSTYAVPDLMEGEIARVVFTPDGGTDDSPVMEVTASDAIAADVPFMVRGDCVGDRVDYSIMSANVDDSGRELLSGTLVCGAEESPMSYSSAYEGVVQVTFGSTDDVDTAWLVVVPGS